VSERSDPRIVEMKSRTFHLRVFVKGRQIHPSACPAELHAPTASRTIRKKWTVQVVEDRLNSFEDTNLPPLNTNVPPIDEESWFKTKPFVVIAAAGSEGAASMGCGEL